MSAHQRGGEVQRRHGSKRISSKDIVEGTPAFTPELLPVLDHHPTRTHRVVVLQDGRGAPPTTAARSGSPSRTPPRRRTRRTCAPPPRGKRLGPAHDHVGDAAVRDREPHPVAPDQHPLEAVDLAGRRERALQAQGRRDPEPEDPVGGDRVVDPDAGGERVGVVVGHLVCGQVGPHVQRRKRRCRASACAWSPRTGQPEPRPRRPARRAAAASAGVAGPAPPPPPRRGPRQTFGCPSSCATSGQYTFGSIWSGAGLTTPDEAGPLLDRIPPP